MDKSQFVSHFEMESKLCNKTYREKKSVYLFYIHFKWRDLLIFYIGTVEIWSSFDHISAAPDKAELGVGPQCTVNIAHNYLPFPLSPPLPQGTSDALMSPPQPNHRPFGPSGHETGERFCREQVAIAWKLWSDTMQSNSWVVSPRWRPQKKRARNALTLTC